jgi:hypothetical protein
VDVNNLNKLREIFLSEPIHRAPTNRQHVGEWVEVVVGIGVDHTAYITIPSDSLAELLIITEAPY